MARNERFIPVPPRQVFEVLADARQYGYVVVGSKHIREMDGHWPQKGSEFHHSVGFGPLTVDDSTEVLEVEEPRRLRLKASARPLGKAEVTFDLEGVNGGTRVTMIEDPLVPKLAYPLTPPIHIFTLARNRETLRRLDRLAQSSPSERERLARKEGAAG